MTVSLPIVTPAEAQRTDSATGVTESFLYSYLGSGDANAGRPVWTKDADGYISYIAYDEAQLKSVTVSMK